MLDYKSVIDSSNALGVVSVDFQNNRMSHAYLFLSKDSNFLMSFAERVCLLFLGDGSEQETERDKMRIMKRIHPDVLFFGEENPVDAQTATEIVEKAQISPFEADKKIFVIANADDMNESAQNKLLKTIEDPPASTFFLILANSTSKLLQTVISRVKQIELDEISGGSMALMLKNIGVSEEDSKILAGCSGGNGEFAEKLAADPNFLNFFDSVLKCLGGINCSRDVIEYSSIFSQKSVDKNEFFDLMMMLIRDVQMVIVKNYDLVLLKNKTNELKAIAGSLNLLATKTLIEACIDAKEQLKFNVNPTSVLDNFLFKLAEVKIKCKK